MIKIWWYGSVQGVLWPFTSTMKWQRVRGQQQH